MQAALNVFSDIVQLFGPRLVHRNGGIEPGFAGFVAGEQGDEVFLRHFALLNTELHDQAFLRANAIHHDAHAVHQVVELLRHQAELLKHFRQLQNFGLRIGVAATFRFDGVTGDFVLRTQLCEFFARQFRVDAVVVIAAVVVFFFVFIIVVVHLFLREFRTDVRGGRRHIFFSVRVNKAGDQI